MHYLRERVAAGAGLYIVCDTVGTAPALHEADRWGVAKKTHLALASPSSLVLHLFCGLGMWMVGTGGGGTRGVARPSLSPAAIRARGHRPA